MPRKQLPDPFLELKELLKALKPDETKITLDYLDAFAKSWRKKYELVDYLIRHPKARKQTVKKKISPATLDSTFDDLCTDTVKKVAESLALPVNTQRPGEYSSLASTRFNIRSELDVFSILQMRGLNGLAKRKLWTIILQARRHELLFPLIELTRKWKILCGIEGNLKEYKKFQQLEEEAVNRYQATCAAQDAYNDYILLSEQSANNELALTVLIDGIQQAGRMLSTFGSKNLEGWLCRMQLEYYAAKRYWLLYRKAGNDFLELIDSNPRLFKRSEAYHILHQITCNDFYTYQFDSVLAHARKAKKLAKPGSNMETQILEEEGLAYFFLGQSKKAVGIFQNLVSNQTNESKSFNAIRTRYFLAASFFTEGNFKQSLSMLRQLVVLQTDEVGYNISIRTLEILSLIELGELEAADLALDNAGKHIGSLNDEQYQRLRQRDVLILKVLRHLVNSNLDFELTQTFHGKDLEKLASASPEHRWRIRSSELVIFSCWFEGKVKDEKFQISVPAQLIESDNVKGSELISVA